MEQSTVITSADLDAGDLDIAAALLEMEADHARGCPGLRLTALRGLEWDLGGLRGLIALAGSARNDKIALAVQLTREVLEANPDACVVFFSLEMPANIIDDRLMSVVGEVPDAVLHNGANPLPLDKLFARLRICDSTWFDGRCSRARIEAAIRRAQKETGAPRCLVIIDSLHACAAMMSGGPKSRTVREDAVIFDLRNVQQTTGAAILFTVELNGQTNALTLDAVMGSISTLGAIDFVIGLESPETPETPAAPVTLRVLKARGGRAGGVIPLTFHRTVNRPDEDGTAEPA